MKIVDENILDGAITSLADAIRSRAHFSDKMTFPDDFISTISSAHFYSGQKKYIMPSSTVQLVRPDSGYDCITEAIVYGDANLVSSNIQQGTSIFGVEGTFTGDVDNFLNGSISEIGGRMTIIPSHFFEQYDNLVTGNFYNCKTICESAFYRCANLKTISAPACESIGSCAFYSCSSLQTLYIPACESIERTAFCVCANLEEAYAPNCLSISSYVFWACRSLSNIDVGSLQAVECCTFGNCYALRSIILPECTYISSNGFEACTYLSYAEFPKCSLISLHGFRDCFRLLSLSLASDNLVTLTAINNLLSTPIYGYTRYTQGVFGSIFVPKSLYSLYLTATNWSYFSLRIVSIPEEDDL